MADLEWLAQRLDRLKELQALFRIDIIWLESGVFHTSGFQLSDETWSASPFRDWRSRPGLARHRGARHLPEPAFPVLPGVLAGADDAALRRILEEAHRLGIEVWGHMGLWSYGAMLYPELAVRDIGGSPIDTAQDSWGACFCPSRLHLNQWLADCLCEVVRHYPIDGFEVDHARYAPPPSLPNLLTCACSECQRQAMAWGIDLAELVGGLRAGLGRLKMAAAASVERMLEGASSPLGVLDLLVSDSVPSLWFNVRARHVSVALAQMAGATREAAQRPFAFGIDVFPPSVAVLGGHVYEELSALDFMTGGFGAIGWDTVGLTTCREAARVLCEHWPELHEERVLRNLYRVFGYTDLALPDRVSGLEQLDKTTRAVVATREIGRMARSRPSGASVYPPVSVHVYDDKGLEMVCESVLEHGLDGLMLAGLERVSVRQGRILAETLSHSNL